MRIFKEEQRFTQPLIIVLIAISLLTIIGIMIKEYTSENSTMRAVEMVTVIATTMAAILPIFFFKLTTRIDEKGIHYKFFPLQRKTKTILWTELKSVSVRKYDALSEYGGWGLKGFLNRKKGKAVNVKGDIGIQLELKNLKKLLIGTQKENDAKKVLETYRHKTSDYEN
tara:strand:+ start:26327 stop:26833 length:507 start_codon:yes stop_codon:yes gene_type:complete